MFRYKLESSRGLLFVACNCNMSARASLLRRFTDTNVYRTGSVEVYGKLATNQVNCYKPITVKTIESRRSRSL